MEAVTRAKRPRHKKASQIADKFPEALVAFDRRGFVTYMNRAAERLLGVAASARLHSSSLFPNQGDSDILAIGEAGAETVEKETVVATKRGSARKAGSRTPVLARMVRLSAPEIRSLAVLKPVARRKSEQRKRIDRLVSLGELAAGVAHEIRNPLAGIGTSAQVLRARFAKDDERIRFADVILDEVGRLEKIIENLLLFARPKQPQLVKHDMCLTIERTLSLVEEQLSKQQVKVHLQSQDVLPSVYVDPGQMSQVTLNLVLNAIQAMPSGGKLGLELRTTSRSVSVSGGRRKGDTKPAAAVRNIQFVRLTVSDTGHGISSENLSKLFTPFFTTKSAGTGLGLSISQAIVREHGGSISISSEEGRGTKVLVDIP
ncbi:MAG: ATP-binding protein, partial [Candidatus Eisenbacteria bacterium]